METIRDWRQSARLSDFVANRPEMVADALKQNGDRIEDLPDFAVWRREYPVQVSLIQRAQTG